MSSSVEFFDPAADSNKDYGTPISEPASGNTVQLSIDGKAITVPEGTSVMRAASIAGIDIPKLCATDSVSAFGSCRLCMVAIEGVRGLPASCTTPAREGMVVRTQNKQLSKLRRNVLELYLSDHPLDCLMCPSNGDCELQDVAGKIGVREVRYGLDGKHHLGQEKDRSNPYFTFNPSKCIVCSRCVRACQEIQGQFAISLTGRGFDSKISAGQEQSFMESDCVSCGACVKACPTSALIENSIIKHGRGHDSITTTCAYCGVGCNFDVQVKGEQVVNMTPTKTSKANHGHSCVKGRFAYGYATHKDRIKTPMIREHIDHPWKKVSWEEAFSFAAQKMKGIQEKYGVNAIGGVASSRCSNEEAYLMQKLIRTGFKNNNIDNCARVCHSPTGYGLKTTLGESAGTQTFDSVMKADVVMLIGTNPASAHPVFGSLLKKRIRQGAGLIVVDPLQTQLVKSPHIKANHHLQLRPGSNVAFINAMAHVIVEEGLENDGFIQDRCDQKAYKLWREFIATPENAPEATEAYTGIPAEELRKAARLFAKAPNSAIYYGLGVTEHSQGSTMVMGIANLSMLTGNLGREGVGVNPMRGQNNVQGACDMGTFPHELPGYRHVSDPSARGQFRKAWNTTLPDEPGLRILDMFNAATDGTFKGLYVQGEDVAQSDPDTQHVEAALGSLECLIVQDLFLNETAKFAHVFLPGSSFLEKNGTFTNAERRISRVRQVMHPLGGLEDWEVTCGLAKALDCDWDYSHPSEIMAEVASLTPTFAGVSYDKIDRIGSIQWPCTSEEHEGTPIMHKDMFVRGDGFFALTPFIPSDEKTSRKYPLLLTTGRILSQYNVGAQTRRTANTEWHPEDTLKIHPHDAEARGIQHDDKVSISSRAGTTVLKAEVTTKVQPGVLHTTFHHPVSGTNVITTDNSDWATSCPEFKVTAVQARKVTQPSQWQRRFYQRHEDQLGNLHGQN
ncbi:formate dehydrogenase subunit alpha [Spongorhabdus nitratireducens]